MIEMIFLFFMSLGLSLLATVGVRKLITVLRIGDFPDHYRKCHHTPMPTMGGLAIFMSFYVSLGIAAVMIPAFSGFIQEQFWVVLLCALPILVIGMYDDWIGIQYTLKFSIQICSAIGLIVFGGMYIDSITNPFSGHSIHLPLMIAYPLTVIWIVGLCNAINLIDGLDGLAAGITAIASGAMSVISFLTGDLYLGLIFLILAASIVGFLKYNFNPASIFMGDTGALFIGFILASLSLYYRLKSSAAIALFIPILTLAIPIIDTVIAPIRRLLSGKHPFRPDTEHIHHRLMRRFNLSHRNTVLVLYGVGILFAGFAIVVSLTVPMLSVGVFFGVMMVVIAALSILGYLSPVSERIMRYITALIPIIEKEEEVLDSTLLRKKERNAEFIEP